MHDGVHPADGVDLVGDWSGFVGAGKVTHHNGRRARQAPLPIR
ncbi:hypothetical protein [Cupriavidus sp. TA19]|nr:hypothetical protein [Cupriavidus sp. TA19]